MRKLKHSRAKRSAPGSPAAAAALLRTQQTSVPPTYIHPILQPCLQHVQLESPEIGVAQLTHRDDCHCCLPLLCPAPASGPLRRFAPVPPTVPLVQRVGDHQGEHAGARFLQSEAPPSPAVLVGTAQAQGAVLLHGGHQHPGTWVLRWQVPPPHRHRAGRSLHLTKEDQGISCHDLRRAGGHRQVHVSLCKQQLLHGRGPCRAPQRKPEIMWH